MAGLGRVACSYNVRLGMVCAMLMVSIHAILL